MVKLSRDVPAQDGAHEVQRKDHKQTDAHHRHLGGVEYITETVEHRQVYQLRSRTTETTYSLYTIQGLSTGYMYVLCVLEQLIPRTKKTLGKRQ